MIFDRCPLADLLRYPTRRLAPDLLSVPKECVRAPN
jgi:hypothetical protein